MKNKTKKLKTTYPTPKLKIEPDSSSIEKALHIVLSFKFCVEKVGFSDVKQKNLQELVRDFSTLTKKTWLEATDGRKQTNLGYEQIPMTCLLIPLPKGCPEDISKLDVFRICNQKARLIGKKSSVEPALFYVFWVDFDFSVYSHG